MPSSNPPQLIIFTFNANISNIGTVRIGMFSTKAPNTNMGKIIYKILKLIISNVTLDKNPAFSFSDSYSASAQPHHNHDTYKWVEAQ